MRQEGARSAAPEAALHMLLHTCTLHTIHYDQSAHTDGRASIARQKYSTLTLPKHATVTVSAPRRCRAPALLFYY